MGQTFFFHSTLSWLTVDHCQSVSSIPCLLYGTESILLAKFTLLFLIARTLVLFYNAGLFFYKDLSFESGKSGKIRVVNLSLCHDTIRTSWYMDYKFNHNRFNMLCGNTIQSNFVIELQYMSRNLKWILKLKICWQFPAISNGRGTLYVSRRKTILSVLVVFPPLLDI